MQLSLIALFLSPVMVEHSAAVRPLRSFNSAVKASTACTRYPPIYAQLYFYDCATAADLRSNRNTTLSRELFSRLFVMCDEYNQFSRIYCYVQKGLDQAPSPHPEDRIFLNPQFNLQLERGPRQEPRKPSDNL